jgi:hypothetical protein
MPNNILAWLVAYALPVKTSVGLHISLKTLKTFKFTTFPMEPLEIGLKS